MVVSQVKSLLVPVLASALLSDCAGVFNAAESERTPTKSSTRSPECVPLRLCSKQLRFRCRQRDGVCGGRHRQCQTYPEHQRF